MDLREIQEVKLQGLSDTLDASRKKEMGSWFALQGRMVQ